ncbi:hypothetical protein BOG92_007390 [Streptomyces sp. WAC00263]|jgi:hypothetical protein|nr:hypothetical protein BOG92_007390 [Streptomyces sp. WAC00263]
MVCMHGRQGTRGTCRSVQGDGPGVTNDGKPSQESIALAIDDIDCKKQTDLVKIWFDAESAIQDKQIADNKTQLTGIKAQRGKEITAARKETAAYAQ